MSIMEFTTRITHKYLMGKTKHELADWIMRDLDEIEKLQTEIDVLKENMEQFGQGIEDD
jgi:hypothetical protein